MTNRRFSDPLWHVQFAVVVAIILQVLLPSHLILGPKYLVPIIEGVLLLGLTITTHDDYFKYSQKRRSAAVVLILLTSFANAASLFLLVHYLTGGGKADGKELIMSAVNIFLTNIIVFGLLYWEMDGGGPSSRQLKGKEFSDFIFPQHSDAKDLAPPDWMPTFIDYLYVSATNATAFSPTDTLPLTHRAKMLMLAQSLISLITVALVTARAVNILG